MMDEDMYDDMPEYADPRTINSMDMFHAFRKLIFVDNDLIMTSQTHNVSIVDEYIMGLEYEVLREWIESERTPIKTYFLSAQTQMWVFAIYELLRTWKQKVSELIKWSESGGLGQKLEALKGKGYDYIHYGIENKINEIQRVIDNPGLLSDAKHQLKHMHFTYTIVEFLRVSLGKHEVSGNPKLPSYSPGIGRINRHCGSLDYEIENGKAILTNINRRDIADYIRGINFDKDAPSDEEINNFDKHFYGK